MCFHSRETLRSKKRTCWNTTSIKCWSARRHQWLEMTGNFGTRLALMVGQPSVAEGTKGLPMEQCGLDAVWLCLRRSDHIKTGKAELRVHGSARLFSRAC